VPVSSHSRIEQASHDASVAGSIVCAWCEKLLRPGDPAGIVSHGVCLSCVSEKSLLPTESLESLSAEEFDRLPFGVIRLSSTGVVLAYNAAEASLSSLKPPSVIGRSFFEDVAPCTKVAGFYGEYLRLKAANANGRKELSFVFRFAEGALLVKMIFLYNAQTQCTLILIKPLVREILQAKPPPQAASRALRPRTPVRSSELFRVSDSFYLATDKGQVGLSLDSARSILAKSSSSPDADASYAPEGDVCALVNYLLSIIHH
jgi:photoactive yellow protein